MGAHKERNGADAGAPRGGSCVDSQTNAWTINAPHNAIREQSGRCFAEQLAPPQWTCATSKPRAQHVGRARPDDAG
eukprot:15435837-Alexandrium_andersonii.AAC.1